MTGLRALLDRGARFDAEYADGLANHLPMALVALQAMGASKARLEAFAFCDFGHLSAKREQLAIVGGEAEAAGDGGTS